MKRVIASAALVLACSSIAFAAPKGSTPRPAAPRPAISAEGIALGAFLGQPTGFTFRMGLAQTQSIEAKAAWNLSGSGSFTLQGNWLIEFPNTLVIEREQFIPYTGGGVTLGVSSGSMGLGLRIPGGIVYRFASAPIELCLEIGIGMDLFPSTSFSASGGLGVRYRF